MAGSTVCRQMYSGVEAPLVTQTNHNIRAIINLKPTALEKSRSLCLSDIETPNKKQSTQGGFIIL